MLSVRTTVRNCLWEAPRLVSVISTVIALTVAQRLGSGLFTGVSVHVGASPTCTMIPMTLNAGRSALSTI
jgi:hypothetical protein